MEGMERPRTPESGSSMKRKQSKAAGPSQADGSAAKKQVVEPSPRPPGPSCVHEVAFPDEYQPKDGESFNDIQNPTFSGEPAKKYPFQLDPFQRTSIACLERNESVLVSAHTSAGKTAVAEYAIAMAFRDKQRVIYTSPLKALSNQKYRELTAEEEFQGDVGLMTGDVNLSPNATCIVMTTEILRSMLYRGSEVLREVAWVVFDEIHYMKDRERGVVWEESIIFLPPAVKMVFLSATMSNALEFAEWIAHLHRQPCHVVYTDQRPTPLQHYAFPAGGQGLYLVVDEKGQFREDNFNRLGASFNKEDDNDLGGPAVNRALTDGGGERRGRNGGQKDRGPSDISKIVMLCKGKNFTPLIVFSFARRECEQYALQMKKLDFNSEEEGKLVKEVFDSAMQCLQEADRDLLAISHFLPLLQRGIAVHHSGLLPVLKELVELLFQDGLIKCLFATETFAMGLNMPAKTVVFTSVRKWDGDQHRWISSGEYIQMSGRAGRRGKDDKGICISMIDEKIDMTTCRDMMLGKPAPLESTFRLSYYTLLNLMSRDDGEMNMDHVIRHSFHQFQQDRKMPSLEKQVAKLETEAGSICIGPAERSLEEYRLIRARIGYLQRRVMAEVLRPHRVLSFLQPGRLIQVSAGDVDFGWGVVINVCKRPAPNSLLASAINARAEAPAGAYTVDTLLYCIRAGKDACSNEGRGNEDGTPGTSNGAGQPRKGGGPVRREPAPCKLGAKGGSMEVVPVGLPLVTGLSALRVALPTDLRGGESRQSVQVALQELMKKFPDGFPWLDPIEDMGIDDEDLAKALTELQEQETFLLKHPLHGNSTNVAENEAMERRAKLQSDAKRLRLQMRESQLQMFKDELRNRARVLRRLGHISSDGVVLLKGRAARLIDTADELLVAELMLNGCFNALDHHQIAALCSVFMQMEKSNETTKLKTELAGPLQQLQETAKHLAVVQRECGLENIDPEDYVASFRPFLMDPVYAWSKGASFEEVSSLTDMFEGTIIRSVRRLDELLNQLKDAAQAVGDDSLEKKFGEASASIRRGIMFANSLYL